MTNKKYLWLVRRVNNTWYTKSVILAVCHSKVQAQNWIVQYGEHGQKYTIEKMENKEVLSDADQKRIESIAMRS